MRGVYNSKIPLNLKATLLETCTFPVLTYGTQTWATTTTQLNGIYKTQLALERKITGTKLLDKIKTKDIRNRTGTKDIRYTVKKLKFKYAGHIARNKEDRWERRVLEWQPRGFKRTKGRPRMRWRDEVVHHCGILWERDAQHRDRWARVGEAYAQRWAEG